MSSIVLEENFEARPVPRAFLRSVAPEANVTSQLKMGKV